MERALVRSGGARPTSARRGLRRREQACLAAGICALGVTAVAESLAPARPSVRPVPGCALRTLVPDEGVRCVAPGRTAPHLPGPVMVAIGGRVDANVADVEDLEAIPDLGPALSEAIVAAREAGGPFRDLPDLARRVRGIGPGRIAALAAYLTAGPTGP